MTPAKQLKLFQDRQAFDRNAAFIRRELEVSDRVDHLQPVLEFLEWLARDMAEVAGVTVEVQAFARAFASLRAQVANRALELYAKRAKPQPKKPVRPQLRLVKGGRK